MTNILTKFGNDFSFVLFFLIKLDFRLAPIKKKKRKERKIND